MTQDDLTVTYCTPEDVAETLDLPDPNDRMGSFTFSDISHPSYRQVCKMIRSNEDMIDRRIRRSWRENKVKNQLLTINTYWHDINGWRSDYYAEGGDYVQLRKDVRPWNPFPVYEYNRNNQGEIIINPNATYLEGKLVFVKASDLENPLMIVGTFCWVDAYDYTHNPIILGDGTQGHVLVADASGSGEFLNVYSPSIKSTLYEGDKIEVRSRLNQWLDISMSPLGEPDKDNISWNIWFDYPMGKMYIKTRFFQQRYNALRISYRYGSEDEELPQAINRLCSLLTASQVLNMQAFNIKVGMGGDINGVKDSMQNMWMEEMNSIWSSYQRSGSVHSMLR